MKYIFFFRVGENNGIFSNWWKSKFVVDGLEFNCVEQYMMWSKAKVFKDEAAMRAILRSSSPADIKKLGRQVHNFDSKKWDSVKFEIVVTGCYNKFSQNDDLKKALIATGESVLVEASPYDRIWGIGLGPSDPRRLNPKNWSGQNLLGKALCEVREKITNEVTTS